jgi:hypothetical protein
MKSVPQRGYGTDLIATKIDFLQVAPEYKSPPALQVCNPFVFLLSYL